MSTALGLSPSDKLSGARAFARSLNILLKHVRLYGLGHKRSTDQLDQAWLLLQSVLTGDGGFLLGISTNKLLLDGVPLETGPSERTFAQMLAGAGVASIHFSRNVSPEDFQRLVTVFSESRPSELLGNLQSAMKESPTNTIRVNEVRFVAHDGASGEIPSGLAGSIAARTITELGPQVTDWLKDPKKLLQLISAAEGLHGGPGGPGSGDGSGEVLGGSMAGSGSGIGGSGIGSFVPASTDDGHAVPLQEEEVVGVIRFLSRMGAIREKNEAPPETGVLQQELSSLQGNAPGVLYQMLFSTVANSLDGQTESPDLVKLAEHLAIKFAVESFERGEVKINAVQQMLDRLNGELDSLRRVLNAHEDKMTRAGIVVESHAELVDRQFWAAVPEWGKKNILLSDDGWCIPARNIRSFVEQLIERRDSQTASTILQKYLTGIESTDEEARRKTAAGVVELADLYGRVEHGLLQQAILKVGRQLANEPTLDLQTMLSAAFVRLNQEASSKRDYVAIEQSLCSLARVEKQMPNLARDIKPRVSVQSRLRDFVTEVQTSETLPPGLVDVLRRTPGPAAEEIANQFSRCTTKQESERYVDLMRQVGTPALQHLRHIFQTRSASEATIGVGLLSRFDLPLLVAELPEKVKGWSRQQQDTAVRQIAASGADQRGELLSALLDQLDVLILPEAVDEIGLSGEAGYAGQLMDMAAGAGPASTSQYVQLKAVESIGRLRSAGSEGLLVELLMQRSLLGWTQPRELRVAAMQALQKINPDRSSFLLSKGGFDDQELRVRPLERSDSNWTRQRRYQRVVPDTAISAMAITSKGRSKVSLERISLGGGFASRTGRGHFGGEATLEMQLGMRHLRSKVLIRETQAGVMFEIADIGMDERSRLRKLIASSMA